MRDGELKFPRRMHNRTVTSFAVALLVSAGAPGCAADPSQPPTAEVSVADAHIATELSRRLPATVTFNDRMGTAWFAGLADPLDLDTGDRLLDYQAGDVAYWPAGQSIIVVGHTGRGALDGEEIIAVGAVTSGFAAIADCVSDCAIRLTVANDDEQGDRA